MAEAGKWEPDPFAFAQRANQLIGLLEAHMEVEEQVLLGVIDQTMSAEEFDRGLLLLRGLDVDAEC